MLQVNYPFPLTDLHQNRKTLRSLQFRKYAKNYLILLEFAAVIVSQKKILHTDTDTDTHTHTPVSYTHLDVYKRQLYNSGLHAKHYLMLFEDVYKRQPVNYPLYLR